MSNLFSILYLKNISFKKIAGGHQKNTYCYFNFTLCLKREIQHTNNIILQKEKVQ